MIQETWCVIWQCSITEFILPKWSSVIMYMTVPHLDPVYSSGWYFIMSLRLCVFLVMNFSYIYGGSLLGVLAKHISFGRRVIREFVSSYASINKYVLIHFKIRRLKMAMFMHFRRKNYDFINCILLIEPRKKTLSILSNFVLNRIVRVILLPFCAKWHFWNGKGGQVNAMS